MVFYLFFSYMEFTSGGKAKWKIYQQHADFFFKFLRIIHQIAFVLQVRFYILLLSQEYASQDVYLLLKENFSEFSCAEFFSTEDKYFLPFEEPRIRGVTVHEHHLAKCVHGQCHVTMKIENKDMEQRNSPTFLTSPPLQTMIRATRPS